MTMHCFLLVLVSLIVPRLYCLRNETEILETALKAFTWISSVSNKGKFTKDNTGQNQYDIYSGSSGVIMFNLEMYRLVQNPTFLDFSKEIADDIIASYEKEIGGKFDQTFFHSGLGGVAFSIYTLSKYVSDTKYADFAKKLNTILIDQYKKDSFKYTGIRKGSAGTGFYLIRLWEDSPSQDLLDTIKTGADILLKKAKTVSDDKIKWLFGEKLPFVEMPNYSGGTSGICHFFMKVYSITKDRKYLETVTKGMNYITSIANTTDGGCLVWFLNTPFEKAKYYLGECNGNSGTGKVFLHLYNATKDKSWLQWAIRSGKNLVDLHATNNWWIPKNPSKGYFWNNMGICDGSSAVIEFLHLLNKFYPQQEYVDAIDAIIHNVMSRRQFVDKDKVYWRQAEWRKDPETLLNQVGLYQGAAGISMSMLHMIREEIRLPLPDYTFS